MGAAEPSFYELYKAVHEDPNLTPSQRAAKERALVAEWGGESTKAMAVSLLPHDDYSILETPDATFATKYRDVVEVFNRNDVFSVAPYGDRMSITSGAFMLGMQDGAQYQREHSLVLLAEPLTDLPAIRRWIADYAAKRVGGLTRNRSALDVVADVAYDVPVSFVGDYYGVPGPNRTTFLSWLEFLAAYIFNWSAAPLKTAASAAGLAMQTYIAGLIEERKAAIAAGLDVPQDVMTRMLVAQQDAAQSLDDVDIRRNLGGLSIGCTMPPCGTISFALDHVMSMGDPEDPAYSPQAYDTILQAAKDDDPTVLENCMLEAARLAMPVPPTLFRVALEDYVLGKGTPRAKLIRAGTTVVAVPSSAMMDPEMVDAPNEFRINRPDWTYVLFGQGQHECLGKKIGKVLLAETVRPILNLPNLRRAPGEEGRISMGTGMPFMFFPGHMVLEYDPI